MTIKTVAVAGVTGTVGPDIVKHLAAAGFVVTALKRPSGQSPSDLQGVSKVVSVDYDDVSALTKALQGHDAVVSALNSFAPQGTLMEAAVAAGVTRFVPSEYGLNYSDQRTSEIPIFVLKLAYRKRLARLAKENPTFSWSVLCVGMFLEWFIENDFMFDLRSSEDPIQLWDGGNSRLSATTYDGIGRGVAGILLNEAATKNRPVHISQVEVTQSQLLAVVTKNRLAVAQRGTVSVSSEDIFHGAITTLLTGGDPANCVVSLVRRAVAAGIGAVLPDLDNELLGVKRLSDGELESLVVTLLP